MATEGLAVGVQGDDGDVSPTLQPVFGFLMVTRQDLVGTIKIHFLAVLVGFCHLMQLRVWRWRDVLVYGYGGLGRGCLIVLTLKAGLAVIDWSGRDITIKGYNLSIMTSV